jgi:hypothetical protein
MKRGAIIGVRNDRAYVRDCDNAIDALQRRRRGRVDALDQRVRLDAPKDLAVQHARQPQMMRILGAAGDFLSRLETRNGIADLSGRCER